MQPPQPIIIKLSTGYSLYWGAWIFHLVAETVVAVNKIGQRSK